MKLENIRNSSIYQYKANTDTFYHRVVLSIQNDIECLKSLLIAFYVKLPYKTTFVFKFYILEFVTNLVTLGSITTHCSQKVNFHE